MKGLILTVLALFIPLPELWADEPPAAPTAEELREHIRALEVQVEILRTQVRLRTGELLVAKSQLRARAKRGGK